MKKTLLLGLALLGGLSAAQTGTAPTVPALPPGVSAPTSPVTSPSTAATYPSGYTRAQLDAVLPLLEGLKTLQGSAVDETRGRVRVTGLSAVDRLALLLRLREAGLPSGVVEFVGSAGTTTGTVTQTQNQTPPPAPATSTPAPVTPGAPPASTLPNRAAALAQPHAANLSGPVMVRAGEANTWAFLLKNTGNTPIHLSHGACDVRFEVLNAAGEIVRPDPKNTLCTMQLVLTDVSPGETREVQKIRWEGKDASGQPVRPGTYTIRAAFDGPVHIVASAFTVTVR